MAGVGEVKSWGGRGTQIRWSSLKLQSPPPASYAIGHHGKKHRIHSRTWIPNLALQVAHLGQVS